MNPPVPAPHPPADAARRAAALVAAADGLLVAAGAGIGVDSGLPDFRGPGGFWRVYPALGRLGLPFEVVASPATFRRDPALAWGFYGHRLALYRRTVPHPGFALLRQWAQRRPGGMAVFTSNVDGQFQRAGFDGARLEECHGSIHHLQCSVPCCDDIWSAREFEPEVDESACRLLSALPRCPHCGAVARPNILMFGDGAWVEERSAAQARPVLEWLAACPRVVILEIGAGTAVPSVRHFVHEALRRPGTGLVRINPREAELPAVGGVAMAAGALAALQAIEAALQAA